MLYELASSPRSYLLSNFSINTTQIQIDRIKTSTSRARERPPSHILSCINENMGSTYSTMTAVTMMLISIPAAFLVGTTLESSCIIFSLLALAGVLIFYFTFSTMSSLVLKHRKSNEGQENRDPTSHRNSGDSGPGAARPQPQSTKARGVPSPSKRTNKSPTDVAQAGRVLEAIARTIASKTTGEDFEFIMKKFEIMCKRVQSTAKAPELDSVLRANLLNEGIQFGLVQLKWFLS